jgi:Transcription factor WhiB
MAGDTVTPHEEEALALLADACLNGAECLYDPALHEGPEDLAGESAADRAVREQIAAEVCATCPVHRSCFDYAVRVHPARGVWAGLTAAQIAGAADLLGLPLAETAGRGRMRLGTAR